MYKGFTVIGEKEGSCCKGKAVWLRHDRTGLQIVHFQTEDKKKYFSFNFKTPLADDMGLPHVLEHMIFTGSQKYPVKDILNGAMKYGACEYCNGYTHQFYTSYPVETYITKDYYNMLDLYGDAVFFPLLRKESFLQEGWHLELDKKGKPFINGVVYNEVSDMAHRNTLFVYEQKKRIMQNSDLRFYAGGKSYELPEMTYEMVLAFYRKHYVPANCVLYIYNHLDLGEQLEFLEKNLLSRLPSGTKEVQLCDEIKPLKNLSVVKTPGFYAGDKKLSVGLGFFFKDESQESNIERDNFLSLLREEFVEALGKNPVGLGGDIEELGSPKNRYIFFYIDGVSALKVGKAKKFLLDFVQEMYEKGIREKTVSCYRINTDHFYSIEAEEIDAETMNSNVVNGWVEQNDLLCYMNLKEKWDYIRPKYENYSEEYFKSLLKKCFVDNENRFFLVTVPDKKYYDRIDKKVRQITKKLASKISKEEIQKNLEDLRRYQAEEDDYSNFKDVTVKDLPKDNDNTYADKEEVSGKYGKVTLFSSVQKVSNSTSITVRFPVDTIDYEDYRYLSGCINFHNGIGVKNLGYSDSVDFLNLNSLRGLERCLDCHDPAYFSVKQQDYEGRQWIYVSCSIINTDLERGLAAFADYIFRPNYEDKEDIEVIKEIAKNDLYTENSVAGSNWDTYEVYSHFGKIARTFNQIYGVNSLNVQREMAKETVDVIFEKYPKLYGKILDSGAIVSVFANEQQLPKSKEAVKKFILESGIKPLAKETTEFPLVEEEPGIVETTIISPVDSGSSSLAFRGSVYKTKEFAADMALLSWFGDSVLQDYVRKQNGAYSVSCWQDGMDSIVSFRTTRDPNPKRSIELFFQCLRELENAVFDEDTVMRIIKANYVEVIKHMTGIEKGHCAVNRHLFGMKPEDKRLRVKYLLELTSEDLHQSAIRLNQLAKDYKSCIVTGDDSQVMGKVLWDYRK